MPRKPEKPITKTMTGDDSPEPQTKKTPKTLDNTTVSKAKDNVRDLKVFGDGDMFRLISKASSKKENWMKSTKALEIPKIGVVIQVTTQQGDNVAEGLVFVPGARIEETEVEGVVIARRLVNDARIA